MTTSYWGLKGQEELSNGVRAVFAMEGFFRPETGQAGRFNGDPMFSRSAYVGLQSDDAGTLTLGRLTTPYFVSTILFNPFGDSYTFSPSVFHTYLGMEGQGVLGDSGWSNAVSYSTPNLSGFSATVSAQAGETTDKSQRSSYAVLARYASGPFSVGGAWQTVRSAQAPKAAFAEGQTQTFGELDPASGDGLALLRDLLARRFVDRRLTGPLRLGPADGRLRARLHALGAVKSEQGDESGWRLELDLPLAAAERLAEESGGHPLHALLLVAPGAPTYNPDD